MEGENQRQKRKSRGAEAEKRAEALRKLKTLREGGTTEPGERYTIKIDEPIYDTVDDDEYQSLVAKRQKDYKSFIVDDDGLGYVDEGQEVDWTQSGVVPSSEEEYSEDENKKKQPKKKKKENNVRKPSFEAASALMGKQRISNLFTSAVFNKNVNKANNAVSCDSILDDVLAEFAPDENDKEKRRRGNKKPGVKSDTVKVENVSVVRGNEDDVSLNGFSAFENEVVFEENKEVIEMNKDSGVVVEALKDESEVKVEKVVKVEQVRTLNAKVKEEKDPTFRATAGLQAVKGLSLDGEVEPGLGLDGKHPFVVDSDGSMPFYMLDAYEEAFGANAGNIYLFGKCEYMRGKEATGVALECKLLKGAFPFAAIHPSHQLGQIDSTSRAVVTSYLTEDGKHIDHSLVAACAVHELSALALDKDGFFWTNDGLLNQLHYQQAFPRPKTKRSSIPDDHANSSWTHASRASAVVKMEHTRLVKKFTVDRNYIEQLFPSIVTKSTTLRFLSRGSSYSNPDGSMQLIQIQLQGTTPIVPRRTFVILRTCKKIDELTWVVADVSVDSSLNVGYPCGCLIQGIADGSSQVTWVEHLELKQSYYLDPKLYNDLCRIGFAFGAQRWVACLERACERKSYHRSRSALDLIQRLAGQDLLDFEKKCVMMISNRMVRDFCLNIGPLCRQPEPSPRIPPPSQAYIYLRIRKSPFSDNPKAMVFFATTTFSLPHSPEFVLRILGDESRRHELDASGRIVRLAEGTCYTTGDDPRNKISVQANLSFRNEVLLQETSVDLSGSLVVWSLLSNEPFAFARRGLYPRPSPLIGLSGVAISSNSLQNTTSSSSNTGGGSVITLGLQQEYCYTELGPKLTEVVKKLVRDTIDRIVAVLNNLKDEVINQQEDAQHG